MAHNGNIVAIYKGLTKIACMTGASVSKSKDAPDATCKDSGGFAAHLASGLKEMEVSGDFIVNFINGGNYDMLDDMWRNGTSELITVGPDPSDPANVGLVYDTAYATLTQLDCDNPMNETITASITLKVNGAPTQSVITASS